METQRHIPSLREVYSLYGHNRINNAVLIDPWQMPKNFGTELQDIMQAIAEDYEPSPMPKENMHRHLWQKGAMQCDASVDCEVFEMSHLTTLMDLKSTFWALWLRMNQQDKLLGEGFLLHNACESDTWQFSHRLVPDYHRGKNIFGNLASALETFVAAHAQRNLREQRIVVNSGQPDVILSFLKRGYLPPTPEQEDRMMRMLSRSDDHLFLAPAQRPALEREKAGEHNTINPSFTSLYCFDQTTVGERRDNLILEESFRIDLQKKFSPVTRPIQQEVIRGALQKTLR